MNFIATKKAVFNRGVPPDDFLSELVAWGKTAPDDIFLKNQNVDIYSYIYPQLGPWPDLIHRKAAMLEALRVLAGFESSWNWNEGVDTTNPTSDTPETMEAGAWQVSANSRVFGDDLEALYNILTEYVVDSKLWDAGGAMVDAQDRAFQHVMKSNHFAAIEWISRLLRRTVAANGPVKRRIINPWLSLAAQAEFVTLLT